MQARDGVENRELDVWGKRRGKSIYVEFRCIEALWLEEDLVPVGVGKLDDLVLD
jgi:hypothetical protein